MMANLPTVSEWYEEYADFKETDENLKVAMFTLGELQDYGLTCFNKSQELQQLRNGPGKWVTTGPKITDHLDNSELMWVVRGYPFTRPVMATSSVGVRISKIKGDAEQFVNVELMVPGFHGVNAGDYGFFKELEWCGPLVLPD